MKHASRANRGLLNACSPGACHPHLAPPEPAGYRKRPHQFYSDRCWRARMLARTETTATIVENWLAEFERALAEPADISLRTLFHPHSHWRDVLALTWHIRTVSGVEAILRELKAHVGRANPTGFRTDPHRTAPRHVTRAGTNAIEAILRFETAEGHGSGVLR